jgi:hypothetical protein
VGEIRRSAAALQFLVFLDGDELRGSVQATPSMSGSIVGHYATSMFDLPFTKSTRFRGEAMKLARLK